MVYGEEEEHRQVLQGLTRECKDLRAQAQASELVAKSAVVQQGEALERAEAAEARVAELERDLTGSKSIERALGNRASDLEKALRDVLAVGIANVAGHGAAAIGIFEGAYETLEPAVSVSAAKGDQEDATIPNTSDAPRRDGAATVGRDEVQEVVGEKVLPEMVRQVRRNLGVEDLVSPRSTSSSDLADNRPSEAWPAPVERPYTMTAEQLRQWMATPNDVRILCDFVSFSSVRIVYPIPEPVLAAAERLRQPGARDVALSPNEAGSCELSEEFARREFTAHKEAHELIGEPCPGHPTVDVMNEVAAELARARAKVPGPQNSAHEGYAVLAEEVDELWDEVKANHPERKSRMRAEAIQVAAMAVRFVEEVCDR